MTSQDDVRQTVANYVLEQFLPGERPEALTETTPLISGGILNSIDTMKLVAYLEDLYKIEFQAYEISANYLEDVAKITSTIMKKLAER